MVLMIAIALLALPAVFPLLRRNSFYMLHLLLVCATAWYVENTYFPNKSLPFFISKWRSIALIFVALHLISINLATFIAYGYDKNAARRGGWRIPENQLHILEFLGGWCGAFLGQKIFHHKSKKRSYQSFFWAMLIGETSLIYIILKYLHFI